MSSIRVVTIVVGTAVVLSAQPTFTSKDAERFAELALSCVHREYPNKISHVLEKDEDVKAPRDLTPVFYGCFDWHSAVHGHWLLVRLCHIRPDDAYVTRARAALARSFTAERVAGEIRYLSRKSRKTFERPYGLAWLLQLCAELRSWTDDPQALHWSEVLQPLERTAADRFRSWLPRLSHAIRTGEHSQTAFALGLVRDWAVVAKDQAMVALVDERARHWHLNDRGAPLAFEPSGQDFLSPCLAEADLMRRVLPPESFAAWLTKFLPTIPTDAASSWLPVATVTDKTDGKLAHLDGLNLARAWMLDGIASGLPDDDPRVPALHAALIEHREAGLAAVTGEHYAGGHWLGSFAVYLVTRRGVKP